MNKQIENIQKFRIFLLKQIEGLLNEQLNTIPKGLNNNIIWNAGHLLCAMQSICYRRSGLALLSEERFINPFLPNTKPEGIVSESDISIIKEALLTTIDTLEADYKRNAFSNYTTSENIKSYYGIDLLTIDDAIAFLLYHEGFHTGRITAIKQLI